jgi:polyisoprenoid-binding protein YceI
MKPLLLLALLQAPTAPSITSPAPTYKWSADPSHSAVGFRVRHLGIAWVNGTFRKWTAELSYDPANPERRDNDLRSADYLASDSFPEITFASRKVERAGAGRLRITGDLTMRGVTRPVVLEAEAGGILVTARGRRTAFTATTTIRRQDFGVVFNRIVEGAQVVGDDVRITIDFEAIEQRQERPPEPKSSGGRP